MTLTLGRIRPAGYVPCLVVGAVFGALLAGVEPVGGDPDRIFRPMKSELSRAISEGRLPFWSDRFGLGIPLIAESQVAAFYPPNWAFYGLFGVSTAYRLSMWMHVVALAAATSAYAGRLGIGDAGRVLAGVSFPLCGFLTIHASHEWAYQALPYLPLVLLAVDRFAETGRRRFVAAVALLWACQVMIGHFQVQSWTAGLAVLVGTWRVVADRRPIARLIGAPAGIAWGACIAAVQLAPTWELAAIVGQLRRSFAELAYYSYPPGHWAEIAIPTLFRRLAGGGEDPYWFGQETTGFEACLYVGVAPLILAALGAFGGNRRLDPWRWIIPASLALATMPRWWPAGYALVLQVPGLGLFRCPGRYTLIASFGLALMAGSGMDGAASSTRAWMGRAAAAAIVVAAFAWAVAWFAAQPRYRGAIGGEVGLAARLGIAAGVWAVVLGGMLAFRRDRARRDAFLVLATASEMAGFYYAGGTTTWGRPVSIPVESPILTRLRADPGVRRVGGALDNIPIRVGLTTASPYSGFPLPAPNPLLRAVTERRAADDPAAFRWLRRYGVTHVVWDAPVGLGAGEVAFRGADPALDRLAYGQPGLTDRRGWRVVRVRDVAPAARVATRAVEAPDRPTLVAALSRRDGLDEAWYLPGEGPGPSRSPRATSARVARWDGARGVVEHDGACDVVVQRAAYPGWTARVDDGPPLPVSKADGGLIAVRLEGSGASRIELQYRPTAIVPAAIATTVALALAVGVSALGPPRRRDGP